ncbi:hypothetical protein QJS10_CPA03g02175 [Acorus calamus]|uniref:Uncharacterized protein n=1 Tax=Acorus calamus TaxID=4465 RepID=A0AAV9F4T0_ACOCL|nr:hypothetical protein QJS10_CPA03g02175 [Acorus calamus]
MTNVLAQVIVAHSFEFQECRRTSHERGSWAHHHRKRRRRWRLGKWSEEIEVKLRENLGHTKSEELMDR